MASRFVCCGRGSGGLEELQEVADSARVQFALLRFPTGSGSFRRNKFVYLHLIGGACPVVKRATWNNLRGDAQTLFGTSTGLEIHDSDEIEFEHVATQLRKVFVADDGTFDIGNSKREYERILAEEKARLAEEAGREEALKIAKAAGGEAADGEAPADNRRKLAVAMGLSEASVLKAIRDDLGPLNWGIFAPHATTKVALVEAGGGGLPEMLEVVPQDQVVFGVVRMTFGTGRFRRTKRVFFTHIGASVGGMARGRANAQVAAMMEHLGPVSAEIRLVGDECSVESIVASVQPFFVVDNIKMEGGQAKPLSEEDYLAALLEEQNRSKAFFGEADGGTAATAAREAAPAALDAAESVDKVLKGEFAWCVLQPK